MRTCVKICGLRSPKDAQDAAAAGADAIGLVFYPDSPRHVSIAEAAAVVRALPPFVTVVGVFVDPDTKLLDEVLGRVPLDLIQFHGSETPAACAAPGRRYLKGLRVPPGADLAALAAPYAAAAGLLLDAWVPGMPGGTGQSLALDSLPPLPRPVVLAGGLHAGNVGALVRSLRPYGVDVSSGVESRPGVKDAARMRDFVMAVRQADHDAARP